MSLTVNSGTDGLGMMEGEGLGVGIGGVGVRVGEVGLEDGVTGGGVGVVLCADA